MASKKPKAKGVSGGKQKTIPKLKKAAQTAKDIGKTIIGKTGKDKKGKGKGDGKKRKTARQMLKKAYEIRARRQIRIGALGQARRTLRKKATVI